MKRNLLSVALAGLFASAVWSLSVSAQRPAVDDEALKAANSRAGEWITHGRTQDEQRFSPLEKISDLNVRQLRLAWTFDTGTDRVLEATPLVVDGVMYTTASWGSSLPSMRKPASRCGSGIQKWIRATNGSPAATW